MANLDPGQIVTEKPSQPETIDDIVDRMVRDQQMASVPRSTFTVRTVGYRVPKGQIIILTSERRLLYFFQDSMALEFTIGVARRNLQRLGSTEVVLKRREPTWVPTALQHRVYRNLPGAVGPGPKNPLGTRALNLTIPMIRIHGTNDDNAIGEALSDGCFRMYNRDIEYLFEIVPLGTKVTILK
jgi:lipoprotein-anchoring transpeptidase ErfK/SrfK